ncbi:hypothetical protein Moror_10448 [Moniliophthora roreri MCA 2997]|uniref:Extracellular membrane protein CFEM domain-containing protein n=1 Tax=Moniliophthora roreri (strain MCA 2997) TaxID=1381753 RepID=V2XDU3_MONRO|nr:hypothetical protein Moror_10448 [Moniliophthora roreri MCA 2997]
MRPFIALSILAAFAAFVSAQNLSTCAFTCITGLCRNSTKCITNSCSGDDLQTAISAAQELCAASSASLSAPTASGTSAGSMSTSAPSNAATAQGINSIAALVGAGLVVFALRTPFQAHAYHAPFVSLPSLWLILE